MAAKAPDSGAPCRRAVLLMLPAALLCPAARAESGPAYLAADRQAARVRLLDESLQVVGSFPTAAPLPAGVARDGERIYTLHPASELVIAYDHDGNELFRWSGAPADGAGMALSDPHELAIRRPGAIEVRRPLTGTLVRTLPVDPDCGSHGLAWDGRVFWVTCGASLRRVVTGPILGPIGIDSPTQGCVEGGTALTANDLAELTVACTSGAWFKVSTADGSILESSNNFIDHFGLAARYEGTPVAFVAGGWESSVRRTFLLDEELTRLASFPATGSNAIATDGRRIFTVRYLAPSTVTRYDHTGKPLSSWDADAEVTGAAMVGAELALVRRDGPIDFHDPESGTLLRSFAPPPTCSGGEALSFDGALLWLLCDGFLVGVDPQSGVELDALPNPATGCFVDGTGLANPAPHRLLIACTNGEWFLVSSLDGAVLDSGVVDFPIYGIKAVRERQSGPCPGVDLLVSQGLSGGGSEDFYDGAQWPELTTVLDRAARRVALTPDLEDLEHMLLFDGLWLDQRGLDSSGTALLTSTELNNLETFLATGRRVVLVGGDDSRASWNGQILGAVGGAYGGEASGLGATPVSAHALVEGITSLSLPTVGTAGGGIPLFDPAFASLWGGTTLSLLASEGAGSEYWPGGDNEAFFTNVGRWIGCAGNPLLFSDDFESGDTSAWTVKQPLVSAGDAKKTP